MIVFFSFLLEIKTLKERESKMSLLKFTYDFFILFFMEDIERKHAI